ncbi:hypothetical protein DCO48_03340 [Pseudomonas sp. SDI]|uniref:RHS repeat-associated core domain-containing protein n=1 Tax=Pseudomonas sp. SDI TaxID=2170734 RepID=UPI000DE6E03E|nr:RHS repeat-associated core domain-containing protein [Pseudomonas sp. SDI]PWB35465.1 hypothetical protein DCO48_03340 [Pseudomonas sp. SDI]
MPTPRQPAPLRYHYDALDRLASTAPESQPAQQRFYRHARLCTELQGLLKRSIFEHGTQPLAQRANDVSLLATDQQGSVIEVKDSASNHAIAYGPYGYHVETGREGLLGFNGQRQDPLTGHYLLGNGYRSLIPSLGRFNSPDSWSPFGQGGLNTYAYCQGDPINRADPTGHFSLSKLFSRLFRGSRNTRASTPVARARSETHLGQPHTLTGASSAPNLTSTTGATTPAPSRPNHYVKGPVATEVLEGPEGIMQLRNTFYEGNPDALKNLLNQRHKKGLPLNERLSHPHEIPPQLPGGAMSPELSSDVMWAKYLYGNSYRVNGKTFRENMEAVRYGYTTSGDIVMTKPYRGQHLSPHTRLPL